MKKISDKAFDAKFDAGEDISEFIDWSGPVRLALGTGVRGENGREKFVVE